MPERSLPHWRGIGPVAVVVAASLLWGSSAAAAAPVLDDADAVRARWERPTFTHAIPPGAIDPAPVLAALAGTPHAKAVKKALKRWRKAAPDAAAQGKLWCGVLEAGPPPAVNDAVESLCWAAKARRNTERLRRQTLFAEHAHFERWAAGPRTTPEMVQTADAFLVAFADLAAHPLVQGVARVRNSWASRGDALLADALNEAEHQCDRASALHCAFAGVLLEDLADKPGRAAAAQRRYEQACTMGEDLGCVRLAFMVGSGRGVEPDTVAAQTLLSAACRRNGGVANGEKGWLDWAGVGGPQRKGRARTAFRRGYAAHDPFSAAGWGDVLWSEDAASKRVTPLLRAACQAGGAEGCALLAELLTQRGGPAAAEAPALHRQACLGGAPRACSAAARHVPRGAAAAERFSLLRRGCQGGWAEACAEAAALMRRGDGGPKLPKLAMALSQRACRSHAGAGCVGVGRHLEVGLGVATDAPRARERYRTACEARPLGRGVWPAFKDGRGVLIPVAVARVSAFNQRRVARRAVAGCVALARALVDGIGGAADPAGARQVLMTACDAGLGRGCAELSRYFREGIAGAADGAQARVFMDKACAAGDGPSCADLGRAAVGADPAKAAGLFERACAAGDQTGCAGLGGLLVTGRGVAADGARGNALLRQACDAGVLSACAEAGANLMAGQGVKRSKRAGKKLIKRACAAGYQPACDHGAKKK